MLLSLLFVLLKVMSSGGCTMQDIVQYEELEGSKLEENGLRLVFIYYGLALLVRLMEGKNLTAVVQEKVLQTVIQDLALCGNC